MRFLIYVLALFFLATCNNPSSPKRALPVIANTPEAVADYWLKNYFDNNFEAAKKWSSPATQAMIDTIQSVLFTENEATIIFQITTLQCTTTVDKSTCNYIYVEADEKIPESIQLQKINGRWLVDAQLIQEGNLPDELNLDEEEFKKELDKIMQ